ncbi:MAG: hypothetical protein GC182_15930 [Rhodopseudomonas sp.]|nr:hypothetical protein [Rhodopseudomonas sp.]
MDTLHTVLRSIRRESKGRRDHLDVFREFLDHLDRAARRKAAGKATVRSLRMPRGGSRRVKG